EVELRNTSDEVQTFSSLLGAEVTDSLNRPWDIGLAGFDLPQVDGDVPPGGARRGWMVFEVAEDSTGLLLRIMGNLTATGSVFALGCPPRPQSSQRLSLHHDDFDPAVTPR